MCIIKILLYYWYTGGTRSHKLNEIIINFGIVAYTLQGAAKRCRKSHPKIIFVGSIKLCF